MRARRPDAPDPAVQSCLISMAAHLSLCSGAAVAAWLPALRDVVTACEGCSDDVMPVRNAAWRLGQAAPGDRLAALLGLRDAVARYFETSAARRWDVVRGRL